MDELREFDEKLRKELGLGIVAYIPGPIRLERVLYQLACEKGLDEALEIIGKIPWVAMGDRIWEMDDFLSEFDIPAKVYEMLKKKSQEKDIELSL